MKQRVRGKNKLHLKTDPPPDLAIEAVHSHDADAAIEVYRRFKVPEVWVCDEDELVILILQPNGRYAKSADECRIPIPHRGRGVRLGAKAPDRARHRVDQAAPNLGQADAQAARPTDKIRMAAKNRIQQREHRRRRLEKRERGSILTSGTKSMSTVNTHNLPDDLRAIQLETEAHARRYGLDFYDTIFEVLDYDELSEIAALGGFPTRYPHWRFGMEYQQLAKGYRYGLQKIYEMVINNDPCYAYLLRCNQLVDQKLVMAHVYGHNDFFKNNIWFSQTNRKMMDEMANHGNRIRSCMERYGEETVENFIDSCLSLENLIDIYSPLIKRREEINRYDFVGDEKTKTQTRRGGFRARITWTRSSIRRRSSRKRHASGKRTAKRKRPSRR